MIHLQKLRLYSSLRWVSFNLSLNFLKSPKSPIYRHNFSCYRLFGSLALNENNGESRRRIRPTVKNKVEAALLEYLRCTRCLIFSDAEHMSKNSPHFVKKLVEKFRFESDVSRSVARFLSYHPINEFEPFFESIGLKPSEFGALLPRNLMFLTDEVGLLDNYHVLCEYGIARVQIGKIYREAREVFRYDQGVLQSMLQAFEEVGISKDVVSRAVILNPCLLIHGMNEEFLDLLRKLKCLGSENSWVEQKFVETTTYNWRQVSHLLQLLQYLGCNDEDISKLVGQCPGILFEHSGRPALLLIGFLLKFGSSRSDICSILLRFPQVKVEKFVWNLRRAFELLFEIGMDVVNIGRIIREHFTWIGTCSLMKARRLRYYLRSGNIGMCQIIMANPLELKKWTLRANNERLPETGEMRQTVKNKVEAALLEYLRCTRCFIFSDAEHMSKNSPHFVKKLVEKFRYEYDVSRSVARFLSYPPINEFEPFFESIGLKPSEFGALLPRNLMFLSDEVGLLDNYHVLCEYGIARVQIGKIYREAREVFRYDQGVLLSKLQAFEEVGISKDVVSRAVILNPSLLIRGMSEEFLDLVRKLKCLGSENSWVEQKFVETATYNWRQISHLLQLLQYLGCNDEDISKLVGRCPGILFDHSGRPALLLIGFLLKFGSSRSDICSILLRFPQVKVEKFVWNLRRAFELLFEIEMDVVNIGRIIREHFTWIGTCSLMKASSLRYYLRSGNIRMCQIIMANPLELKKWTLGANIERLPETGEMRQMCSLRDKIKFLTSIGFVENSKEIEKVLIVFRGKGDELPKRFDCFVKAGLSESDVAKMIKMAPRILNQSTELLEAKISVLVNDLGYPVSRLVSRLRSDPHCMSYTLDRVKLRCAMYKWLIDQNVVRSTLSLCAIIGCTESRFINKFVNRHPLGPQVWQEYKQTFITLL